MTPPFASQYIEIHILNKMDVLEQLFNCVCAGDSRNVVDNQVADGIFVLDDEISMELSSSEEEETIELAPEPDEPAAVPGWEIV